MMSLAWPLFRVTEQAALAAWPQTGCGDKNKIQLRSGVYQWHPRLRSGEMQSRI